MCENEENLSVGMKDFEKLSDTMEKILAELTYISEVFATQLHLEMARSDYALRDDSNELKEALDEYYDRK